MIAIPCCEKPFSAQVLCLHVFFQWRHPLFLFLFFYSSSRLQPHFVAVNLLHDKPPSYHDSVWKATRLSASPKAHMAMLTTTAPVGQPEVPFLSCDAKKKNIKLKAKKALNCVVSI